MANSFEIEGKLHKKYDAENKSQTFQTREFVLETQEGTYPNYIKFQLTQERCSAIDPYQEGEQMKVHFDLRGREWQGKYFTNLTAWRLEKASAAAPVSAVSSPPPASSDDSFPSAADEPTRINQDLPF